MTPHMRENTVTLFFHFVLGSTHLARSLRVTHPFKQLFHLGEMLFNTQTINTGGKVILICK